MLRASGKDGLANTPVYFDASVMIIAFVLTGRLLEERAKQATASSLRTLMGLQPKTARIMMDDEMKDVPLSTITVGDVMEVRAGEKIPVDGTVNWADSFMTSEGAYVDESMITRTLYTRYFASGDILQYSTVDFFTSRPVISQISFADIVRLMAIAPVSMTHSCWPSSDATSTY